MSPSVVCYSRFVEENNHRITSLVFFGWNRGDDEEAAMYKESLGAEIKWDQKVVVSWFVVSLLVVYFSSIRT